MALRYIEGDCGNCALYDSNTNETVGRLIEDGTDVGMFITWLNLKHYKPEHLTSDVLAGELRDFNDATIRTLSGSTYYAHNFEVISTSKNQDGHEVINELEYDGIELTTLQIIEICCITGNTEKILKNQQR